ncbi:uncharacterized protein LOC143017601 [Oratosquilla oratoria]|uniref:uncharacterized protein LOC143017601 n=1 Tax=Oratosquilla oratoria TaxID=337810 RepID=UPI003F77514A
MGPLCFLILINDALADTPHRWKYVDDCTVGIPVSNTDLNYDPLQDTVDKLHTWTVQNKIFINHKRTVVMHFHTSNDVITPPLLAIDGLPLQVVQSTKLHVDLEGKHRQHHQGSFLQAVYAASTEFIRGTG